MKDVSSELLMASTSGGSGNDLGDVSNPEPNPGSDGGSNPNNSGNNESSNSLGIKRKHEGDEPDPIRDAPNPPVSPPQVSTEAPETGGDSPSLPVNPESPGEESEDSWDPLNSDSVQSDQNGLEVPRKLVVDCPCDVNGCICNERGGCVQSDLISKDDCCDCSGRATYLTGYSDDGHKNTDHTYCEVCDCKRCSSCWSEQQQPGNTNRPNHPSNNDPNSSDRNR